MKKILSIIMVLALPYCAIAADEKTTTGKLGAVSDGNGGCKTGFGMCDLKTQVAGAEFTMGWQLSSDMTTLNMIISNEMMMLVPPDVAEHMEQGEFLMQVGYTFPPDVSTLILPGGEPIVIPAGTYNVTLGPQGYTVQFTLQ